MVVSSNDFEVISIYCFHGDGDFVLAEPWKMTRRVET
jgi:hypothetical protein